jgi:hypothetical protein
VKDRNGTDYVKAFYAKSRGKSMAHRMIVARENRWLR